MALYLPARAKVNLHLRVVGRRPDGYHELETLFSALQLHDELWAERVDGELTLQVAGADLTAGDDNLVLAAARAFAAASPASEGARFFLRKAIPMGAGLGGGSSDAAAALRLLNALSDRPLGEADLHALARGLGADVPFFLDGGTQWATGIGERLAPVTGGPPLHLLLIVPPFPCDTVAVYKNHRAQLIPEAGTASIPASKALSYKELEVCGRFANDLEATAMELYPDLAVLRDCVVRKGLTDVRLTGSGSTLFVARPSAAAVDAARRALGELEADGIRLLRTRSAGDGDRPVEVPWPEAGT